MMKRDLKNRSLDEFFSKAIKPDGSNADPSKVTILKLTPGKPPH